MNYTYVYKPGKLEVLRDGKCIGGFTGKMADAEFSKLVDSGKHVMIGTMDKSNKISKLRSLWIAQGIDNQREVVLSQYEVESTKDLSESQLDELIFRFTQRKTNVDEETRSWRSNILRLLTELKVYDNTGDWTRVNQYLMNPKIAGKLLYQMSVDEMITLAKKLRSIKVKQSLKAQELNRLQKLN